MNQGVLDVTLVNWKKLLAISIAFLLLLLPASSWPWSNLALILSFLGI